MNRHLLAALSVAAALGVRLAVAPWVFDKATFMPFLFAIAATAAVAGMRPGLVATGLSVLAAAFFLTPPTYSLRVESPADRLQLALFGVTAGGICWLSGSLHNARRRVERERGKLLAERERFRLAAEAVNGIIYEYDLTTGRVERTRGLYEVVGYRPDEAPPTAAWWWEQTHPDDREASERQYTAAAGKSVLSEYRVRHKDGRWLHIEDRAVLFRDGSGKPVRLVGCGVDVTARKQAEEQIARHKRQMEFVLSATGVGTWFNEYPLSDLKWDEATRALFFVRPGETPTIDLFWGRLHPDDREPTRLAVEAAVRDRTLYEIDHRAVEPGTGEVRWVRSAGKATYGPDGAPIRFDGINYDITDRRRVEDKLRRRESFTGGLLGSITDAFFALDKDWRFTFVNDEIVRRFGVQRAEIVGGHIWEMFPAAVGNEAYGQLHRAMAERAAVEYEVFYEPWQKWLLDRAYPTDDGGLAVYTRDITARKRSEERLRESEERLRLVVESATDYSIFTLDGGGIVTGWNSGAERLFGYSAAEVVGLHDRILYTPDDAAEGVPEREMAKAGADGRAVNERWHVRKDGGRFWGSGLVQPLRNEGGAVVGFLKIMRDVTDARLTEGRLRESEQQFRATFEQAAVGFAHVGLGGRWLRVNQRLCNMLGYDHPQLMGLTFQDITHPDDLGADMGNVRRVLAGETPTYSMEKRYYRKDRSLVWCNLTVSLVRTAGGEPDYFISVVEDITANKQAEERLRQSERALLGLVERCPFGIYIVDADFRILTMNTESQAGAFANVRPVIGRPFDAAMRVMWPEPVAAEVIQNFRHTLDTGDPYYSKDFVNPRADIDQTEGYEWQLHQIKLADGRPGVVCYYYDSTRLRQVERALKEADRRKDEFLATLAHELRNPLAPIRNGLQVIRLAGANGTVEKARSMMDRQLTQLVRLVDDLLDVSRVTSGKLELRKQRVEVRAVIDAAVETSRPAVEQAGHELAVAVPDEPIFVDGDATRLAQVVSNLLNNSAKYTHRGGRVRLAVGREDGSVAVSVRDDGIGIPPAMLGKVFEMFTQVDRALEKTTGGLGIGLSLVKGLVEMHGGTIEARSEGEGLGSEFVVRLPVVTPGAVGADHPDDKDEEIARPGLRRILVVDDNADSADSLGQLLEMMGNEVRTAYDGEAGVAAAEAFRPAVVLCDIGMPKLNGYDAARLIRAEGWGKDVVLVALTGWGQDDDRRKTSEAGFDHHLVKPVEAAALMKLLAGLPATTG